MRSVRAPGLSCCSRRRGTPVSRAMRDRVSPATTTCERGASPRRVGGGAAGSRPGSSRRVAGSTVSCGSRPLAAASTVAGTPVSLDQLARRLVRPATCSRQSGHSGTGTLAAACWKSATAVSGSSRRGAKSAAMRFLRHAAFQRRTCASGRSARLAARRRSMPPCSTTACNRSCGRGSGRVTPKRSGCSTMHASASSRSRCSWVPGANARLASSPAASVRASRSPSSLRTRYSPLLKAMSARRQSANSRR